MNRTFLVQELHRLDAELVSEGRYAVIRVRHDDPAAAGVALRPGAMRDGLIERRRADWSEFHVDRAVPRNGNVGVACVGFMYGAMIQTRGTGDGDGSACGARAGARPLVFELADLVSHMQAYRAPLSLADLMS